MKFTLKHPKGMIPTPLYVLLGVVFVANLLATYIMIKFIL